MDIDLGGQAALVVARAEQIGEAARAALAANGASVWLRDPSAAEPQAVVAEVLDAFGRLDILVFISPTFGREAPPDSPVSEAVASELWQSVAAIDRYILAASDALAKTGARIVLIGSVLGLLPIRAQPLGGLPDAALFNFARAQAMRLGSDGVRINALALGAIGSETTAGTLVAGRPELLSHTARQRSGTLQEVAEAMLFLVDPANSSMTGHILPVDGGLIAGFARDF
jgi:NAD(P)-dependent dehydrogenase (short-subunit alcohol dehydrogenase family)